MPYDETVDRRIGSVTAGWPALGRKKMFGGICYLLHGNMVAGVYKEYLILRLGEAAARAALGRPHVKPMDITGRPMKGWVMVAPQGFDGNDTLAGWLEKAREFVAQLPPKG